MAGKIQFEGLEIDQDRRWRIVWSLSAIGSDGAEQLIESELIRDASERGQQSALGSRAAHPSVANKKQWLREISSPSNEMSLMRKTQILSSIFPYEQQALREDLRGEFYEILPALLKRNEFDFAWEFAASLAPTYCNLESIKELGVFISENPELPPGVMNSLRVAKQEDERCVLVRSITHSHILEKWKMQQPNAVQ
jgi:aminopeptidase N